MNASGKIETNIFSSGDPSAASCVMLSVEWRADHTAGSARLALLHGDRNAWILPYTCGPRVDFSFQRCGPVTGSCRGAT